jgi:hypothetical protein
MRRDYIEKTSNLFLTLPFNKKVGAWIWCKYCVHMYVNGKMRPVETIPGMGLGA